MKMQQEVIKDVVWTWDVDSAGKMLNKGKLVYCGGTVLNDVVAEQQKDQPDLLRLLNLDEVEHTIDLIEWDGRTDVKAVMKRCINAICPHTISVDSPVHQRPVPLKCHECDIMTNLWACLSCGYVGCGRISSGGHPSHGANGHAILHFAANPAHTVCVKLGTITPKDADLHCYSCDQLVQVVGLTRHLLNIGIDRAKQTQTDHLTWDWGGVEVQDSRKQENLVSLMSLSQQTAVPILLSPIARLPHEMLVVILAWIGPASSIATFGLASRACAKLIRSAFTSYLDTLSLKGQHSDSFFAWNKPLNLCTLTMTGYTPRGGFALPLLHNLRIVMLEGVGWWGMAGNLLGSLAMLPCLESLSFSGGDPGLWDALADLPVRYPTVTALDVSNISVRPAGLETLLAKFENLEALRLTQSSIPFGGHIEETVEIFEILKRKVPRIKVLEYVGLPESDGVDSREPCRKLLDMPCLEIIVCRSLVITPMFLSFLPSGLRSLKVIDLLSSSEGVTTDILNALLLALPDLKICPKSHLKASLPPGRLITPVTLQRYFRTRYFKPYTSTDTASWVV